MVSTLTRREASLNRRWTEPHRVLDRHFRVTDRRASPTRIFRRDEPLSRMMRADCHSQSAADRMFARKQNTTGVVRARSSGSTENWSDSWQPLFKLFVYFFSHVCFTVATKDWFIAPAEEPFNGTSSYYFYSLNKYLVRNWRVNAMTRARVFLTATRLQVDDPSFDRHVRSWTVVHLHSERRVGHSFDSMDKRYAIRWQRG